MLLRNKKTKYVNGATQVEASQLSYDKPKTRRFKTKTNVKKKEIVYEPPAADDPLYRAPGIEYVFLTLFIIFVAVWVNITMPLKQPVPAPAPAPPPIVVGRPSPWWPLVKEIGRMLSAQTGV
tara:strand:- start:635 stop:1000 length:366 start_codon:yes stop_codon:yes gene_type:complete